MFKQKGTFDLVDDKNDAKTPEKSKFLLFKGLLLAMLTGFSYSILSVIVKQMKNIHPGQLAMYQFMALFAFSLPEVVKCQEDILGPRNLRFLLFLRGIIGTTNWFLCFIAYRYLPLGESTVIISSAPVFVTAAARVFLKEPCGLFQTVTVFTTVVGIIFTTKLPLKLAGNQAYTKESIYGLVAAIGTLFFKSGLFIVMRKVKRVHHSVISFNFAWVAVIETAILTALVGDFVWHNCGLQSLLIVVFVLLSFAAVTLLTMALQCEFAGPVSMLMAATQIVFAFVFQTLFFEDVADIFSSVGAVVVGMCVFCVGLKKWVFVLPTDSDFRKRLGWMLK